MVGSCIKQSTIQAGSPACLLTLHGSPVQGSSEKNYVPLLLPRFFLGNHCAGGVVFSRVRRHATDGPVSWWYLRRRSDDRRPSSRLRFLLGRRQSRRETFR